MTPALWTSLFMGDVYAKADVSLIVVDEALHSDTIAIKKGSWWANPIVFWLWLQMQFVNCISQAVRLRVSTDVDGREKSIGIEFGTDGTYNFEVSLSSGDASWLTEVGLFAADFPVNQSVYYVTDTAWLTTFPVKSYLQGAVPLDGVSTRTNSGASYSVQGRMQETRKLSVQFDRRVIAGQVPLIRNFEFERWRRLWRKFWAQGRSVSFWLELPNFATDGWIRQPGGLTWGVGADKLGRFDQLITVPDNRVWRPRRLVESQEFLDGEEAETVFYLKPKRVASDPGKVDLYWIPT